MIEPMVLVVHGFELRLVCQGVASTRWLGELGTVRLVLEERVAGVIGPPWMGWVYIRDRLVVTAGGKTYAECRAELERFLHELYVVLCDAVLAKRAADAA